MGLSAEESEDRVEGRFEELCLDLNMDKKTKETAWNSYERIKKNFSLEVRLGIAEGKQSAMLIVISVFVMLLHYKLMI